MKKSFFRRQTLSSKHWLYQNLYFLLNFYQFLMKLGSSYGGPAMWHETICNYFQNGGSKNVDIPSNISSLKCSGVTKLYNQNSLGWKLIPVHFINNLFGKNFIFHSNLSFKTSVLHQFPTFYVNILQSWKRNFSHISYTTSCIGSQFLWFSNYIRIDNNSVCFKEFSSHNVNLINQLFTSEGEFKDWIHIKR